MLVLRSRHTLGSRFVLPYSCKALSTLESEKKSSDKNKFVPQPKLANQNCSLGFHDTPQVAAEESMSSRDSIFRNSKQREILLYIPWVIQTSHEEFLPCPFFLFKDEQWWTALRVFEKGQCCCEESVPNGVPHPLYSFIVIERNSCISRCFKASKDVV